MNGSEFRIDNSLVDSWKALLAKNSQEALQFYFFNILPVIEEKFVRENVIDEDCDVLVSLMGFSPETIVLTAASLKPKELIIVTGQNTVANYDLVVDYLVRKKILSYHQISLKKVDIHNLDDIYQTITRSIVEHKTSSVIVDITGGKKIMSASAAQAAWEINAPLCYVEGDYDPIARRPALGSERLEILSNPSREKARQARREAITAWKMRNFSNARDLFTKSRNVNKDHSIEEIAIPLCDLFGALYNFDMNSFKNFLKELEKVSQRDYMKETVEKISLNGVLSMLRSDPELKQQINKIAVFLSLSKEYSSLKRIDFAALLSYRALEAIVAFKLKDIAGGEFDLSEPDYTKLHSDPEFLKAAFLETWSKAIKKGRYAKELPQKIAFIDGITLLATLQPQLIYLLYPEIQNIGHILQKVRGISDSRNQSILAHGYKALNRGKYQSINDLALRLGKIIFDEELNRRIEIMRPPDLEKLTI